MISKYIELSFKPLLLMSILAFVANVSCVKASPNEEFSDPPVERNQKINCDEVSTNLGDLDTAIQEVSLSIQSSQFFDFPSLPKDVQCLILSKIKDPKTQSSLAQTCSFFHNYFYTDWENEVVKCRFPPQFTPFLWAAFSITQNDVPVLNKREINRFVLDFELNKDKGIVLFLETFGNPSLTETCHDRWDSNHYGKKINVLWKNVFRKRMGQETVNLKNHLAHLEEDTTKLALDDDSLKNAYLIREIGRLEKLEILSCTIGFTALSPTLCGLKNLRVLQIGGRPYSHPRAFQLWELPAQFGDLCALEELRLSNSTLKRLPSSFSKLTKLRILDLALNKFKSFPDVLLEVPSLEHLSFSNLKDDDMMCKDFDDGYFLCIRCCEIDRNEITSLPDDFSRRLSNLKTLNLSGNDGFVLPKGFSQMTALHELRLSYMGGPMQPRMDKFEPEKYPRNLERLFISGNYFAEIPLTTACLSKLKLLEVNVNRRELHIPEELRGLKDLKILTYN